MQDYSISEYFYGDESSQFVFFRIPRELITGARFKHVSTDAKLLYGMLLDRMGLSSKNGWYDDDGRVYIYYTIEEICFEPFLQAVRMIICLLRDVLAVLFGSLNCLISYNLEMRVNNEKWNVKFGLT